MVGECFGRCSPASLSLWLPQTKGPALSAATEQAMKGSLSERHKERKEETWVSGTGFSGFFVLFMPIFFFFFYEKCWWSLCVGEHVCVPACLPHCASLTLFRAKWKNLQEIKWLWIIKKKVNKQINNEKNNTVLCCAVGLLTCDKTNTNEAIWPERQVNEECWLKWRAECRIKGLSCSLWAMLCADSCFNKTLRGGSGYQVDSDKEPHNEKGKRPARGSRVHTRTNTYISNTSNMCVCVHN